MKTKTYLLITSLIAVACLRSTTPVLSKKPGYEVNPRPSRMLAQFNWPITYKPFTEAPVKMVSSEELERILSVAGVDDNVVHTVDDNYLIPDIAWWKKFCPAFDSLQRNFGYEYTPEVEDCDDFSRLFCVAAQHTLRLQYKRVRNAALVGEFHYKSDSKLPGKHGPHVVNVVGAWENGKPSLRYIEPQSGNFITLTDKEIKSCFFARF